MGGFSRLLPSPPEEGSEPGEAASPLLPARAVRSPCVRAACWRRQVPPFALGQTHRVSGCLRSGRQRRVVLGPPFLGGRGGRRRRAPQAFPSSRAQEWWCCLLPAGGVPFRGKLRVAQEEMSGGNNIFRPPKHFPLLSPPHS